MSRGCERTTAKAPLHARQATNEEEYTDKERERTEKRNAL